jgi:hypothetical protein
LADRPAVRGALLSERRKMRSGYRVAEGEPISSPSPPISRQGRDLDGYISLPLDMACGLSSISRSGIRGERSCLPTSILPRARSRVSWTFIYFHSRNLIALRLQALRTIIRSVSAIMDSQQAQPVQDARLAIDVRSTAFSVEEPSNPLLA